MKRVRSWLAGLVGGAALLCVFSAQAATLDASVDRTTIEDGDVVQLTLEIAGQSSDRPDTTPLEKDFEVLGTSNMTQMNFINGRATSSTRWIVNLRPRRIGTLTIPALRSGDARSEPITIRVGKNSQTQGANPDIFLEVEVSPPSPYVQAQLLYSVRLYHAVALQSGQLSAPRNDAALIHKIGDDRQFAVTRDGRRYQVIERRYAVFAQQSGKLTIQAPVFEGEVIDTRRRRSSPFGNDPFFGRDPFGGMTGGTRAVRLRGEAREIHIKPRPAGAQGQSWVPAQSVEIGGQWQPEQSAMKVGEPVTLTLSMTALGLTGTQLPEVVADKLDGFSVYPDRAEVDTAFTAAGIARGTRVQKIAFIPRQAGTLTIPDVVLRWWNTQTDREEIARLPGITLSVTDANPATEGGVAAPRETSSIVGSQKQPAPGKPPAALVADATTVAQDPASRLTPADANPQRATRFWMWLSALLVVAWAATAALWVRDRRRVNSAQLSHTERSEAQASSDKIARKQILAACTGNDAAAARRALLAWGAVHWPDNAPRGLEQVALRVDDQNLRQALIALDRALYTEAGQWNASELKSLLDRLPKTKPAATQATSALPLHYAQTQAR